MNTLTEGARRMPMRFALLVLAALAFSASSALAHDVTPGDAGYIQEIWGVHIIPFVYLGAKHMITGYDHILFLQHHRSWLVVIITMVTCSPRHHNDCIPLLLFTAY